MWCALDMRRERRCASLSAKKSEVWDTLKTISMNYLIKVGEREGEETEGEVWERGRKIKGELKMEETECWHERNDMRKKTRRTVYCRNDDFIESSNVISWYFVRVCTYRICPGSWMPILRCVTLFAFTYANDVLQHDNTH